MSRNIFNQNLSSLPNSQFRLMRNDPLASIIRARTNLYNDITIIRSIYMQTNNITTTERSIGMPANSNDNLFVWLTTPSQIQITSTSANDTSVGTGAQTVYIEGLTNTNGFWAPATETFTMNGQTPVTSTITNWWRINKMWVNTSGSLQLNEGDIYISPNGAGTTAGVPAATNTLAAMIATYANSTMGIFSVGSNQNFQ
jgi:hypothetical protein